MFLTVGLVLFAQNEKDVSGLRHREKWCALPHYF